MVVGHAKLVEAASGASVTIVDALPEFTLVRTGKHRAVLLRLMFEDRFDLERELALGHRHQNIGLIERPLLPGTAIEPDNRPVRLRHARDCLPNDPETDAVRAMWVGK